jgi:tetratricopeptide (TPR) repeat protein
MALYDHKRWEMAEKEFRAALGQDPEHAGSHAMLSLCLQQLQRYQFAIDEAQVAIQLDPENARNYYVLYWPLAGLKRFTEAQDAIDQAKRLLPHYARYHAEDARLSLMRGMKRDALEKSLLALSLDPQDDYCMWVHAMALYRLGQRDEAIAAAGKNLELAPEGADAHSLMGWILLSQWSESHWDLIKKTAEKLSWADDTTKCEQYQVAGTQLSSAIEHFVCALRLEPTDNWASEGLRQALGDEFKAAHQTMKASKLRRCEKQQDERILTLCTEHLNEQVERAWALVELGHIEEAGAVAQEALRGEEETAYTHAFWGWISLKQKQANRSTQYFRDALQLQPNLTCARVGLMHGAISQYVLLKALLPVFSLAARVLPESITSNIVQALTRSE